jgi:hypothetical protein
MGIAAAASMAIGGPEDDLAQIAKNEQFTVFERENGGRLRKTLQL